MNRKKYFGSSKVPNLVFTNFNFHLTRSVTKYTYIQKVSCINILRLVTFSEN